jgi:hypothetical protein
MPGPVAFPALLDNRNVNSGPALSVYYNGTFNIVAGVYTKIPFNVKEYDTCNGYNISTGNYKPNVAGYYMIVAAFADPSASSTSVQAPLYKNDALYKYGNNNTGTISYYTQNSFLIYLNGTSDYISIYGYQNGSTSVALTATTCYLQAVMIRPA